MDEYAYSATQGAGTDEERQRAVAAWLRLEEIREWLQDDHPVSRAMDQWLDNADDDEEDDTSQEEDQDMDDED